MIFVVFNLCYDLVSVCPSVCLSVRHKSDVLLKLLNAGSCYHCHTAQGSSFLMSEIITKFDRVNSSGKTDCECSCGRLKSATFDKLA